MPVLKTQVFTVVKPMTGPRDDNWGVCRCSIAGQRITIPIKGTWPCRVAVLLPGQTFQARLSEAYYQGTRQLNAERAGGIVPADAREFAVMQQMANYDGGRFRRSMATLVKNMSRTATAEDGPRETLRRCVMAITTTPTLGQLDPLTDKEEGKLRPATAAGMREAYRKVLKVIDLQARFPTLSADMVAKLNPDICESVASNPYLLCVVLQGDYTRSQLITVADGIAVGEGLPNDSPQRLVQHLASAVEFSTTQTGAFWADEASVVARATESLRVYGRSTDFKGVGAQVGAAAKAGLALPAFQSIVETEAVGGSERRLALRSYANVERDLARHFAMLLAKNAEGSPFPKAQVLFERLLQQAPLSERPDASPSELELSVDLVGTDPEQVAAVRSLLGNWLAVVHGPAGTGKTDVIKCFILLVQAGGDRDIWAVAPTGRAASNLERRCASLKDKVATIHSRLNQTRLGEATMGSAVCIEETSMANAGTVHSFLDMYSEVIGPLAIFGDDNQLPAIGPMGGALLRDLIEAGCVPCVLLGTIHRQGPGNSICTAAATLLNGTRPEEGPGLGNSGASEGSLWSAFKEDGWHQHVSAKAGWHMQIVSPDSIIDRAIERVRELHAEGARAQMLACCNAGCQAANAQLQTLFNPEAERKVEVQRPAGKTPLCWREGDTVVHLTNLYCKHTKQRLLANGETGVITEVCPTDKAGVYSLKVTFPRGGDRESYVHTYETAAMVESELLHAYCMTTHRAQGSEFEHVVSALENNANYLSKELAYTSVTRGKQSVTLVTSDDRMARLLLRSVRTDRVTRLAVRIKAASVSSRKRAREAEDEWQRDEWELAYDEDEEEGA